MEDLTLLDKLREIIHRKKGNTYYAEKLGVPEEVIEWARQELKKQGITGYSTNTEGGREVFQQTYFQNSTPAPSFEAPQKARLEEDVKNGTAEVTFSLKKEIHDLKELIQHCSIDTSVWDIQKYVQNYWGNEGDPHWQVKAWLEKKQVSEKELLQRLLREYSSSHTPLSKKDILINEVYSRPTAIFISLADFHLDKKTIESKTIPEKVALYEGVLDRLLYKAYKTHLIDEIVFTIGNDFMHTDNYQGATTNLTPQDTLDTWYDAYEQGFDLMVKSIKKLSQFCNRLHVIHIPSNHARTKEYYMAHALEVYFKGDSTIIFNRSADNTKVYTYGATFLGLHHGDTTNERLPLYFASRYYQQWGACRFKEIALADKHHRKEWKFTLSQAEVEGVRMFIAPSLSGADKWHTDKCYDQAIKAGICRAYDKEYGFCTEFEERI